MWVKVVRKPEYEMMSLRDTRIMIIAQLFSDQQTIANLHDQMLIRHKNRNGILIVIIKIKTFLKV